MAAPPRKVIVCSCEDTMRLDADAIRTGCRGANLTTARHLCRTELHRFQAALKDEGPITVACTQESALFDEAAEEAGRKAPMNPWNAATLEWTAPSPPPHLNWGPTLPTVYRGPYEYSDPDASEDYLPQTLAPARAGTRGRGH